MPQGRPYFQKKGKKSAQKKKGKKVKGDAVNPIGGMVASRGGHTRRVRV